MDQKYYLIKRCLGTEDLYRKIDGKLYTGFFPNDPHVGYAEEIAPNAKIDDVCSPLTMNPLK